MRRSTVLLILLFALLWQSLALARAGSTVNALADAEHTALHWQGKGHHHHGDGSYHLDDSPEATQHVLIDHVGAAAALWNDATSARIPTGSATPTGVHDGPVPNPTLDGLLRPPRSHS